MSTSSTEVARDQDCSIHDQAELSALQIRCRRLLLLAASSTSREPLLLLVGEHRHRADQSPGSRGNQARVLAALPLTIGSPSAWALAQIARRLQTKASIKANQAGFLKNRETLRGGQAAGRTSRVPQSCSALPSEIRPVPDPREHDHVRKGSR